ncbi:MAG: DUF488 domain-containing protein [Ktedonobacterales bacterium]
MAPELFPPETPSETPSAIYTVGHSNQPLDRFLDLLQRHGISTLIDVRSAPYARYATHFNRPDLSAAIALRGIRYRYLGAELGGRPEGEEYYGDTGHVLYYKVATAPFFLRGLTQLLAEGKRARTAIMCSEEDPTNCHRRLLIGRVLGEQAVPVIHLRADDREQTAEEFLQRQAPSLWDDLTTDEGEDVTWTSTQSVLPKNRQRRFSSYSNEREFDV